MKQIFRFTALAIALLTGSMALSAQEVNTLYFLENAPQRTLFNPALMPVSSGYIEFTPLGYTSLWVGNNALSLHDLVYTKNGQTITALNQGETDKFLKKLHRNNLFNMDLTTTILAFGARTKKGGYFHGGIFLRADAGLNIPKGMFSAFVSPGSVMLDLTKPVAMSGFGLTAQAYAEIMGGYTRPLNDEWTIGGKLKFLVGLANARVNVNNLTITPDADPMKPARLNLAGDMSISTPGALDPQALLPAEGEGLFENMDARWNKMIAPLNGGNVMQMIRPAGYGAAIDFGFTYKPIKYVQISAAINDLGFIYWANSVKGTVSGDMEFDGIGEIKVKADENGNINSQEISDQIKEHMQGYVNAIQGEAKPGGYARMTRARLNIGIDGLFWENRVGVGLLSQTKLYNNKVYEELTLGGFFRPVNWFNLAVSYSLINGQGGTFGAALGFAPYDGIMLTLATDFVPCIYADASPLTGSDKQQYYIPYKNPGANVALGFSIVWGTNKKRDANKDGVLDNLDLCPRTPRNIRVDAFGCPADTDADGVPDYLDECQGTPKEAYGMVDASGCNKDSDLDGVPDYMDKCPNTPEAAFNYLDENGCPLDMDEDGVPDYMDKCPRTVYAARQHVDTCGCDKDSDLDGVPDYLDECPYVAGVKENKGCPQVKRAITTLLKKAMTGIQFETGKAVIVKKSYGILDEIAKVFIENPAYIIEVQGHTDNVGKADVNMSLSEKRAQAVREYLVKAGVDGTRMTAHGYGSTVPIADNSTKAGRAKNRRVEFKITFEEVKVEMINDRNPGEEQPAEPAAAPATEPVQQ